MLDFNCYPEVMGFGRPNRLLATAQPKPLPADTWKPYTTLGFEVNGIGQLRTAFALPPVVRGCGCCRCAQAEPKALPDTASGRDEVAEAWTTGVMWWTAAR